MENSISVNQNKFIKKIIERLQGKLISFQVINRDDRLLGLVRDVYLPQDQDLFLLISLANFPNQNKLFLLNSNYVEKIVLESKLLTVNLTKKNSYNLPLYQPTKPQ